MDTQQMPMKNMGHDTFWREDQVSILFQSSLPLFKSDGTLNLDPIKEVDVPKQLAAINNFLSENHVPVTLEFLPDIPPSHPMRPSTPQYALEQTFGDSQVNLPPGVYPFGFKEPIKSAHGPIATTFICVFHMKAGSTHSAGTPMAMARSYGGQDKKDDDYDGHGDNGHSDDDGHGDKNGSSNKLVRDTVNILNKNLNALFVNRKVPITVASPSWLGGGTPGGGSQGCPLTPPIPVENPSCANYSIQLPELSEELQPMTGKGVTVFILDSFPERGVISRAAQNAGANNPLLNQVNASATFDYDFMSGVQEIQVMAESQNAFVGKDVYGVHYPILIPDHGLFIAGIVHDLAPDATIVCIRVLDDLCVGDLATMAAVLWNIYYQKASPKGSLYTTPVVINLSLVIPTKEEASSEDLVTPGATFNDIWANVGHPLLALSQLGVVTPASAGNEGDGRVYSVPRPGALFPAAFGNPPLVGYPDEVIIDGVIPVGAVDCPGSAMTYSCYPGPNGVATFGGVLPTLPPPEVSNPIVSKSDLDNMIRGIYSSVEFPPLSNVPANPPEQYYTATNEAAWAYWVGTSFATPIITGVVARILELNPGLTSKQVHQEILALASSTTTWDKLDPDTTGVPKTSKDTYGCASGQVLKACQPCDGAA